jgi:hypothetical protein
VNGKAEVVVQDAGSYQELLDAPDEAQAVAGIRAGLESMERGEGKPASEALVGDSEATQEVGLNATRLLSSHRRKLTLTRPSVTWRGRHIRISPPRGSIASLMR